MRFAVLLLFAVLVGAEYRYKLRGPPHPPLHYGGSPFYKGKWAAPRPLLRSPIVHHHSPSLYHVHGSPFVRAPLVGPGPIRGYPHPPLHKAPVIPLSWDSTPALHTFQAPVHKEHFNPAPPPPEFDYHVAKPAPAPQQSLLLSSGHDDDKGPIHTIPAPNLSLVDKPFHVNTDSHSSSLHSKPSEHAIPQGHNFDTSSFHTGFSSTGFAQPIHVQLATPVIALPHLQAYEVHEPSNDQTGYTLDGRPAYYAPDPDPSLPAHRIPATTDPHSLPSNGKSPSDLLESKPTHDDPGLNINSLTSQDLLQLLQGLPVQSQLSDQHFHSQGGQEVYQQGGISQGENSLGLKNIRDDFQQQYHNFKYQHHQYDGHGDIARDSSGQGGGYSEQEGAESIESVAIAQTPSGAEKRPDDTFSEDYDTDDRNSNKVQDTYLVEGEPENESDPEEKNEEQNLKSNTVSPSFFSQIGDGGSGTVSTSFYTTLPSRQAAETLASLATAGSNSHRTSTVAPTTKAPATTRSDGDWIPQAASVHESVRRPDPNPAPPAETVDYPEYEDDGRETDVVYEDDNHDKEEESEAALVQSNLQFGARIRPKRKVA